MGAGYSHNDEPISDLNTPGGLPWKMGTTERTVHGYKHFRGAQPSEFQHPALKHCRETRMYRDQCTNLHGNCEYKIEAHFLCLEQFFPQEKVEKLRKSYRNQGFDNYEVCITYLKFYCILLTQNTNPQQFIDNLVARAPYYYQTDYVHNFWTPLTNH